MHLIHGHVRSQRRRIRRESFVLASTVLLAIGFRTSALAADPVPPAPVERVAARGFPEWTVIDQRPFLRNPTVRWNLYLEEWTSGQIVSGARTTPIRQTRIRIALQRRDEGDEVDVGYVQHLSNVEIAVLEPGDPRLDEPPAVNLDPENPWPNPAGWNFVDLRENVDLDDDDDNDLLLRYYATAADPRAQGIAALSADEFGTPRLMDLSEFVGTVKTEGLHLVDLDWPDPRMMDPILHAIFLPAEGCRFLAQLGIHGETQCDHCCSIQVYLRRAVNDPEDRLFRPFFDRERQGSEVLDRVRHDIALVSTGEESPELTSAEEAALARVASFFYLTGSGIQSRLNLEKALGERANNYKSQLLLDRIENYFLRRD